MALVREAIDLGVNFLDTAENYETEPIVGKAIKGRPRDSVVISTKSCSAATPARSPARTWWRACDESLRKLDTDYVDIFHLHGLSPPAYDRAMSEIVPALLREKEKGKFRHLAVSETGPRDPEHKMLERAVEEPLFEVVMLAFHMMNQNARKPVLEQRAGQQRRHALHVRGAQHLLQPDVLEKTHRRARRRGEGAGRAGAGEEPAGLPGARAAAPRASSMPPTASPATSRASTSCCSARAASTHLRVQHRLDPAPAAAGRRRAASSTDLFGHLVGVGLDLPDRITGGKK